MHDALTTLRVLVIEDEPITQAFYLESLGSDCEVMFSAGVEQGIELSLYFNPDVAIIDLALPDGDGQAAVESIRKSPLAKPPYLLIATAQSSDSRKQALLDLGADDVWAKPVDVKKLKALIQKLKSPHPNCL